MIPAPYAAQAMAQPETLREAELFERFSGRLKAVKDLPSHSVQRVKTVADVRRLWTHVYTMVVDPNNKLPPSLRAAIASTVNAAIRDLDSANPDLDFQIEILSNFAAGLRDAAAMGRQSAAGGSATQDVATAGGVTV